MTLYRKTIEKLGDGQLVTVTIQFKPEGHEVRHG